MEKLTLIMSVFLVLIIIIVNKLNAKLLGDHICQREIVVPKEVFNFELRNKTTRTYKWCMNVPPRCSVYSYKTIMEKIISTVNSTEFIEECCNGFIEVNNYCRKKCPNNCNNGICLKGSCVCETGWIGILCDNQITTQSSIITRSSSSASTSNIFIDEEFITNIPDNNGIIESTSAEDAEGSGLTSGRPYFFENLQFFSSTTPKLFTKPAARPIGHHNNEENAIFKEHFSSRNVEDIMIRTESAELENEDATINNKSLIYSFCGTSLLMFIFLVVGITLYAIKKSRKRLNTEFKRNGGTNKSIFHTPLPDPPMIENPSYATILGKIGNLNHHQASKIQPHFQLVFRNSSEGQYHYDHPSSTGSYRASSEVDKISQYNLSRCSLQQQIMGTISEPVYDEIPSQIYMNTMYERTKF